MMSKQILLNGNDSENVSVKEVKDYRVKSFAVVLYPQDDERHAHFMKWIDDHSMYRYVYIVHDRDFEKDENGECVAKKAHTHMLITCPENTTLKGFLKFFKPWISYAEPIKDLIGYLLYMLHDTPNSLDKARYFPKEMKGDEAYIKKVQASESIIQKTNLGELLNEVKRKDGDLLAVTEFALSFEDESMWQTFQRNQYLISNLCRQVSMSKKTTISDKELKKHICDYYLNLLEKE